MVAVQDGTLDRNIAVVAFQGYRVLHNFIELERRVRETDELEVRLLDLEDAYAKGEATRSPPGAKACRRASKHRADRRHILRIPGSHILVSDIRR